MNSLKTENEWSMQVTGNNYRVSNVASMDRPNGVFLPSAVKKCQETSNNSPLTALRKRTNPFQGLKSVVNHLIGASIIVNFHRAGG